MTTTNSALMIEWGIPIPGRETKALEEFMNHVAWWTDLQAKGKVAAFRVYGPVTGDSTRVGFVILEGTDAQIEALRTGEDFRTRLDNVYLVGQDIRVSVLETGDAMGKRMQRYGKAVKERLG